MNVLDVFVAHFLVVPGWMILGETIGEVGFSGGPGEIKLCLSYSVLHPPVSHVKCFG